MDDEDRFWSKVRKGPSDVCWPWMAGKTRGYGMFNLTHKKAVRAHRLAYQLTYGEIPTGLCVCHKCDTPACVNPNHLFLGTVQDNTVDMYRKGRGSKTRAFGERSGKAVLTEDKVRDILQLHKTGVFSHRRLAEIMAVSKSAVQSVIYNRTWKHVHRP